MTFLQHLGGPCRKIEIVEASHPVPDANGRDAALRMGELVKGLTKDDLVLCLISGWWIGDFRAILVEKLS